MSTPTTAPSSPADTAHIPVLDTGADLTQDWIETILRVAHPEVRVAAIEPTPVGAGNVSDTVRVAISYAEASGSGAPDAVVVKFRPSNEAVHQHGLGSGAYHREIGGYRSVGERQACRIPTAYFVGGDETNINLVMEDLTTAATPGDQIAGCGPAEANAVITEFAKLHSTFHPIPADAAPDWLIKLPDVADYWGALVDAGVPIVLEHYDGLNDEAKAIVETLPSFVREWHLIAQKDLTITHGDPRVDNVLFETLPDGSPRAVLIDWQVTGLRNPMYDVGYFLSGSVSPEDRRAHEHDLLAHYVEVFAANGGTGYDLATATADYQLQLLSGLIISTAAVGVLGYGDVAKRLITALLERNCAAAADWHSIEAIRNVQKAGSLA